VVVGAASTILQAACGGGGAAYAPAGGLPSTPAAARPSFVLILTDDLDVPTMDRMPRLSEFARQALSFTRFYVAVPLCAPSRASILTGEYAHNHGVLENQPPWGGFPVFRRSEASTVATWLKGAGYRTSLVGKYINTYAKGAGEDYVPPGWDDWHGHLDALEDGRYYNYWVNDNGSVIRHGATPEEYSADVETKQAVDFLHAEAGRPAPIFLYLAPQAPHVPATSAERHGGEFRDELAPRVPSFNESDVREKPAWVRNLPYLTPQAIDWLDGVQRSRMRSLSSVEDMLEGVTQALAETGRLETTYILFTSDNGLLMGQHRGCAIKANFYEETIRVPLLVRGPGVPAGTVEQLALNIDLAPTLAELAGLIVPKTVDGRSLAPFLRGRPTAGWRAEAYVEFYAGPDQKYGLRSPDWYYANSGEVELYDMRADPYQLSNLRRLAAPADLQAFEQRAQVYAACRGASCRP
jgi:arylsulfatase A-like enzyme